MNRHFPLGYDIYSDASPHTKDSDKGWFGVVNAPGLTIASIVDVNGKSYDAAECAKMQAAFPESQIIFARIKTITASAGDLLLVNYI